MSWNVSWILSSLCLLILLENLQTGQLIPIEVESVPNTSFVLQPSNHRHHHHNPYHNKIHAKSRITGTEDPLSSFILPSPLSLIRVETPEDSFSQNETNDLSSSTNIKILDGGSKKDGPPAGPSPTLASPRRKVLGTIREALYIVIPMTVIYTAIFVIGLVGNVSTCVVIAKNNYMHTATNYYLFSLAVSDLLLLLSGLPQEMYLIWYRYPYIFGEAFCVIRGLAAETSANATVLTITAFTVERYVAICHPLRSHTLSQLSRVIRTVIIIWILALALALPQATQFGVIDEMDGDRVLIQGAWCTLKRVLIPHAFEISICVFFVIPMTILCFLYILIGLKLWRSRRPTRLHGDPSSLEPRYPPNRHSQAHVIRMLVAVVVAFFVCWAPFHAQRLLAIHAMGTRSKTLVLIYDFLTHVSGILYFLSTCINPILYHIMSNKFRQAFKDTISRLFGPQSARIRIRTYSDKSNRSLRAQIQGQSPSPGRGHSPIILPQTRQNHWNSGSSGHGSPKGLGNKSLSPSPNQSLQKNHNNHVGSPGLGQGHGGSGVGPYRTWKMIITPSPE